MPQFDVFHVVGDSVEALNLVHHLVGLDENNSASLSTNFLMSHGQATRSTLTCSRVIHFMRSSILPCMRTPPSADQYLGRCETAHCRACSMGACGGNAARNFRTVGCASILSRHRQKAGGFGYMLCPSFVSPNPYLH